MKLNSTMKHRRIHIRLLISMLTVALRFSYLLISKDNVFNAEGSGSFNIRAVDTYYYGVLSYSLENTPANYINVGSGTTPLVSPTTPNYYYHYKFVFNNFGCYNGRLQLTFDRGSFGINDSIIVEGAVLYSSSNDTSGAYITIEFNGDKYATMDIYIRTATNYLSYSSCTALDTWTEHGNSVAENVENAYNQLVNINTILSTCSSTLSTISSRVNTTNSRLNTTNSRLQTIINKLDTIGNTATETDISVLNDFSTKNEQIDNIVNNYTVEFTNRIDDINTEFTNKIEELLTPAEGTMLFLNNVIFKQGYYTTRLYNLWITLMLFGLLIIVCLR